MTTLHEKNLDFWKKIAFLLPFLLASSYCAYSDFTDE